MIYPLTNFKKEGEGIGISTRISVGSGYTSRRGYTIQLYPLGSGTTVVGIGVGINVDLQLSAGIRVGMVLHTSSTCITRLFRVRARLRRDALSVCQ